MDYLTVGTARLCVHLSTNGGELVATGLIWDRLIALFSYQMDNDPFKRVCTNDAGQYKATGEDAGVVRFRSLFANKDLFRWGSETKRASRWSIETDRKLRRILDERGPESEALTLQMIGSWTKYRLLITRGIWGCSPGLQKSATLLQFYSEVGCPWFYAQTVASTP